MKKKSFILGLVFLMFVSSVVYPNRVKDTEQSWEEEEDRSIISSPTLSIDENNIYIHSNKLLDGLNVKIINIKGNVLYNDIITVSSEIEYPISIDFLLNGDYKIFISKGNNYLVVQSAKPPVHLFKTKRFYFEVLFQNEASLLEQNQTAFKWTSNPI